MIAIAWAIVVAALLGADVAYNYREKKDESYKGHEVLGTLFLFSLLMLFIKSCWP